MRSEFAWRIRVVKAFILLVGLVFAWRLFDLQVLQHENFEIQAKAQHEKRSVLPARRGKILVRKHRNGEELTPLATNNTLKMLFVDPLVLAYPEYNPRLTIGEQKRGNAALAAEILAPILIHARCEKIEGCVIETDPEKWTDTERLSILAYTEELKKVFTQIERTRVLIDEDLTQGILAQIEAEGLPGIWIEGKQVWANPTSIGDVTATAEVLASFLGLDADRIEPLLNRRPRRYVEVIDKIVPDVSDKILELKSNRQYAANLRGVGLIDEEWRYYPDRALGAQLLGFVDSEGNGQYGVEGRFDLELKGKEGYIFGATNTRGQRILGKGGGISRAQNGADVVLSIDRRIQGMAEKILEEDLEKWQADFGQIVVVEPPTGRILAMANAPSFDPNNFRQVFQRYEITPEQEQSDRLDKFFNQRIPTETAESKLYRYFNIWGPQVFRNKIVVDSYEPGSVMKAVTMAAALNSDEVTPQTIYQDDGPVEIDRFKIRNADKVYAGPTSMISVLNRSLNTGIAFITRKMGSKLVYEYLRDFGFGQFTDIELDGEEEGTLEHWGEWVETELITRGFGQGVTASPLQMTMAFAALANGGYLMKPILVEQVNYQDGRGTKKFLPEAIRRVISDETSATIKSMLLSGVNRGAAEEAQVFGYSVMGKTGTSQTYKNGYAQEGLGTTIASFAGFGPIQDPAFVVLVKFDYPKTSQWGSETAAITFKRMADFLFEHLEIPPDRQ